MKVWVLTHDCGYLIHVSRDSADIESIRNSFPNHEVRELKASVSKSTFYLPITVEASVKVGS